MIFIWRICADERATIRCNVIFFTCTNGEVFIPPVLVHHISHYTQYLHYSISRYWLVRNLQSGYMDLDRWIKSMARLFSMCVSYTLNPQILFYDGHDRHFWYWALNVLCSQHIQAFVHISVDSTHDHPNYNFPIFNLNHIFFNSQINWMSKNVTLEFTICQMNNVMVEIW